MDLKNRKGAYGLHGKDALKYLGQCKAVDCQNTDIFSAASGKRSYPRQHVPCTGSSIKLRLMCYLSMFCVTFPKFVPSVAAFLNPEDQNVTE